MLRFDINFIRSQLLRLIFNESLTYREICIDADISYHTLVDFIRCHHSTSGVVLTKIINYLIKKNYEILEDSTLLN